MSVDVSGKRFTVPREITASGNFLTVKFYVKDMPIPRSLYNRISWHSGTPNQLKYYREGDNTGVVVYNAGEWVSDAYYNIFSKITFATGTTLTDSEYEWLTSFAVEETLYLAEGDSLGKVANAIRDRSWAVGMYNFPDGFDAAIRAIGNYYTGGTVAWNQLVNNGNFSDVTAWSATNATLAAADNVGVMTATYSGAAQFIAQTLPLIRGHIYYIHFSLQSSVASNVSASLYTGGFGTLPIINADRVDTSWSEFSKIIFNNSSSGNGIRIGYRATDALNIDDVLNIKDCAIIDLTAAFGLAVSTYLNTLESNTPGTGVAKFRELFPDDYYAYQAIPVLMSFKPGDWPVNAGTELHGILTLDGEGWHRDADEYNNGVVLRKYTRMDMDAATLNWQYNNTYDYFYANGLYNLSYAKINDDSPIVFISDAYPTGGMILSTQGPADMTDGYIYQKSNESYPGLYKGIMFYVKDTSITSDHLNTFMTKIAGKKLVIKNATSSYYNP